MTGPANTTTTTTTSSSISPVEIQDDHDDDHDSNNSHGTADSFLAESIFAFQYQHYLYYQQHNQQHNQNTNINSNNDDSNDDDTNDDIESTTSSPLPPLAPLPPLEHEHPTFPTPGSVPPDPLGVSSRALGGGGGRGRRVLQCVTSLAVPLAVILLLLVPSVVVIVGLVGLCLIPVGALVCIGLGLHFCAPETLSNVALVRETGPGGGASSLDLQQHQQQRQQQQQQQWDADWTMGHFLQVEHALVIESRSRTDLEQALLVKRVVATDPGQDQTQIDMDPYDHAPSSQPQQQAPDADTKDEETFGSNTRNDTAMDKGMTTEPTLDVETGGCPNTTTTTTATTTTTTTTRTIRAFLQGNHKSKKQESGPWGKRSKSSSNSKGSNTTTAFDPTTMIRFHQISKSCCDICMMEYEVDDEICESKNPDCDHIFHKTCILDWMQKNHSCPCCRRNYLGEDDDRN